jgi:hypothetical protein
VRATSRRMTSPAAAPARGGRMRLLSLRRVIAALRLWARVGDQFSIG